LTASSLNHLVELTITGRRCIPLLGLKSYPTSKN